MEEQENKQEELKLVVSSQPKFKVGDKVIVIRQALKEEDHPDVTWPPKKRAAVGHIGSIIEEKDKEGRVIPECYLVEMDDPSVRAGGFTNGGWTFPATILKRVSKWKVKALEKKKESK